MHARLSPGSRHGSAERLLRHLVAVLVLLAFAGGCEDLLTEEPRPVESEEHVRLDAVLVAGADVVIKEDSAFVRAVVNEEGREARFRLHRIVTPPRHAAEVRIEPDSFALFYQPHPNFFGLDSLRYVVADRAGTVSEPRPLRIQILPVNDPR